MCVCVCVCVCVCLVILMEGWRGEFVSGCDGFIWCCIEVEWVGGLVVVLGQIGARCFGL